MARTPARHHTCPRCGARLARDNDSGRCTPCHTAERDRLTTPPALPATFWDHQPVRQALHERHLGKVVRAYRYHPYHGRLALPQDLVARWLGITQAQLSRAENSPPMIHLDRLIHWAQLLHIPAHLLWFKLPEDQPAESASPPLTDVTRRTFAMTDPTLAGNCSANGDSAVSLSGQAPDTLAQLELIRQALIDSISGGSASTTCLDYWEQLVLQHGEGTKQRAASEQLPELATDFDEIRRLLDRRMPSSSFRRLTRIAAQMAGLVFLTLIKMGEPGHARSWIRTARIAADETGDPTTRSWVRGQEAYVHYYSGDYAMAIAVASEAQTIARNTPCAGVPLAAALQARAEARLGHLREAQSALNRAENHLGALSADTGAIASAFGYDEAQLRFHESNTYTHLRFSTAARSAQDRALTLYPQTDFLDRTLVRFDQAICLATEGDADAATAIALGELCSLNEIQRSGLISGRAWDVYRSLPNGYLANSPSVELHDLLMLTIPKERG